MKVRSNLWLISDTHFGHDNIVKFQQRPKNHEIIMLGKWIQRVREEDFILHMGDVCMGGQGRQKDWLRVIKRLPGTKFLLMGNHDNEYNRVEWYEKIAGFTVVNEFVNAGVAFTHIPIAKEDGRLFDPWDVNIHGHTHGNIFPNPAYDDEIDETKTHINVCVERTDLGPVQVGNILPGHKWDN